MKDNSIYSLDLFVHFLFYWKIPFWLRQPSEFNTYHDIEAAYNCLENDYGIKQEGVILYGQSVGSGPTLHLASRLQRLRGVVLHSAILSGIRVLYPVKMTFWFDIFKVSFNSLFSSYLLFAFWLLGSELRKLMFISSEYRQNTECHLSSSSYSCKFF